MPILKSAVPASFHAQVESMRTSTQHGSKPPMSGGSVLETKLRSGPRSAAKADFAHLKTLILRIPKEPEDAKLTGDTRSLDRRVLGLNLGGSLSQRVPKALS